MSHKSRSRWVVQNLALLLPLLSCLSQAQAVRGDDSARAQHDRWVQRSLDRYVPSLGGAIESLGSIAYEDSLSNSIGLDKEQRQRLMAFVEQQLIDHTLFTISLQDDRHAGRKDDEVR